MLTRRQFLRTCCAGAFGASGLGFYVLEIEPHWVELVFRPLPIRELPQSLEGRTLVHLTDLHVGGVSDEYVKAVFERVAALRPDIVVATGDLITCCRGVFDRIASVYRRFPVGRLATLATLGNHDYGPNWSHPEIANRVVADIAPFGITVLRNQIWDVEGLRIVGFDDLLAKRFYPKQAAALLPRTGAVLALSHNPDTADFPAWDGYEGWILSGHTHGGQCKPPFLRPPLLPCRNGRYIAGEIALSGGRRMYIGRGVGHLYHVRFNVRPEVTVFELCRA